MSQHQRPAGASLLSILHPAYEWSTKMSELDGRLTALTVAIKHLFELLERKGVMTFAEELCGNLGDDD
jgi:hypothetical protein